MREFERWSATYQELVEREGRSRSGDDLAPHYSDEAYRTFPRYLIWRAILDEIERLNPRAACDCDELQRQMIDAGYTAQTFLTEGLPAIAQAVMAEERNAFAEFTKSISREDVRDVTSIAPRRVLAKAELGDAWRRLKHSWDVDGAYWWPLREGAPPGCAIWFHTDWFTADKAAALRSILQRRGVATVVELREFGEWGCETETDALDPVYTGEEGYWFSSDCDWLVYASHESSITLAGDWLVAAFRGSFPDCDRFSYGGPMSTADGRGTWKWPAITP